MSASYLPKPIFADFAGRVGSPAANRKVFFYENGSRVTKQPIYKTPKKVGVDSKQQANPIILSADGRPVNEGAVWLDPELIYSVVVTESDGSTVVYECDNVPGGDLSLRGSAVVTALRVTEATALSLVSTAHAYQNGSSSSQNLRLDTTSVQSVLNSNAAPWLRLNPGGGDVIFSGTGSDRITFSSDNNQNSLAGIATDIMINGAGFLSSTESGSGVFTLQGGNTLPRYTIRWDIISDTVYMHFPEMLEPDISTVILRIFESFPTDIWPAQLQSLPLVVNKYGAPRQGRVRVGQTGRIAFYLYDFADDDYDDNFPADLETVGVFRQTIIYNKA